MKLELKKIKYSPSLSKETNAFTAELWVDDMPTADCLNSGQGGGNRNSIQTRHGRTVK